MRVAVTGVTGFVGGAVARALAERGDEVTGLGRRPATAPAAARAASGLRRYLCWDLASGEPAPAELRDVDAVVHAAAHVAIHGHDTPFRRATVDGTARLLDAVGPRARLVVIGSASVYDPRRRYDQAHPAREEEAPVEDGRYLNAYARSKASQERLVLGRRPDALVLRPRAVWGPGDRTLAPRVLARVRSGFLPLPGGGRHPSSVTSIDSLVLAVLAGLDRATVAGPLNVADATPVEPARLVAALAEALAIDIRILPVPTPLATLAAALVEAVHHASGSRREPPLTRYAVAALARPHVLDLGRLHGELAIRPDASIDEGASRTAAWIRRPQAASPPGRGRPEGSPGIERD